MPRDPRWNYEIDEFIYKAGWDAKFIGLGTVPKGDISVADGSISIPKHYTNLGSVYYRKTKPRDLRDALRRSEEFLNFHLDLLLSIAASDVLNQLMFASFGFDDRGPWKKFGLLSLMKRFGWGEANVTQPDGFFVSDCSILGIEIKLGATTSPNQLLKYVALMMEEEKLSGERSSLGLLYLVPGDRKGSILAEAGAPSGCVGKHLMNIQASSHVRKILTANPAHAESVCQRLRVSAISWSEINERISRLVGTLGETPAEVTLRNLVEGFADQLETQVGTSVQS